MQNGYFFNQYPCCFTLIFSLLQLFHLSPHHHIFVCYFKSKSQIASMTFFHYILFPQVTSSTPLLKCYYLLKYYNQLTNIPYSESCLNSRLISVQFSSVTQSCPTLSDPMDCSPPGSSIHGLFQARVLESGAIEDSNKITSEKSKRRRHGKELQKPFQNNSQNGKNYIPINNKFKCR